MARRSWTTLTHNSPWESSRSPGKDGQNKVEMTVQFDCRVSALHFKIQCTITHVFLFIFAFCNLCRFESTPESFGATLTQWFPKYQEK